MTKDERKSRKKQASSRIASVKKELLRVKRQLSSMGLFNEAKDIEVSLSKLTKTQRSLQDDQ